MKLLKDDELVAAITGPKPLVTGHGYVDDWYSKGSPIQASSVDLTIGDIFLPGAKRDEAGGETAPHARYSLGPGQTAIVTTREELHVPPHLAAIGFPPSRVSVKGLLMTNPGHVDPGYVGKLRFTLINMGSQQYALERGAAIVTLLVFELSGPSSRDWLARGNAASHITQGNIDLLTADFLNVTHRASEIANSAVTRATWRATLISAILPASIALLALLAPHLLPGGRIETELKVLKESLSVEKAHGRIARLEEDLKALKTATCQQSPRLHYCEPSGSVPTTPKKGS